MALYKNPARPEIKFGVWDAYGSPADLNRTRNSRFSVGHSVWPKYTTSGYYNSITSDPAELAECLSGHRRQWGGLNLLNYRRKLLQLSEVMTGYVITDIRVLSETGYSRFELMFERGGSLILRSNRWNYYRNSGQLELPTTEGPWTIKRWLKTNKTVRFTDGSSLVMTAYGRLNIEEAPDWFWDEWFED